MSIITELAAQIAAQGVPRVFGIPGSGRSLELLDALENLGIQCHVTHFEGAAAIMAGTVGHLSGTAGVALSIKGPGLANMTAGLAACQLDALPVVAVTEAYHPNESLAKIHKRLDHSGLVSAVSKGIRHLGTQTPGFGDLARWACDEVPGPVVLELTGEDIERQPFAQPERVEPRTDLLQYLEKAKQPVIIAGTLAVRKNWSAALNSLQLPVFSTAAAKGVVDETLPHAAGVYTGVGLARVPEQQILPQADLVIGLGLRSNEVLSSRTFHCPAINIDVSDELAPGIAFEATAGTDNFSMIMDHLEDASWGLEELSGCLSALGEYMLDRVFLPAHVFATVAEHFHNQVRLVLDTGYFCTIGEHQWRSRQAAWCLGSGQGRFMGIGLPTAVAAALQSPEVPTVLATGDGGIGMFVAELKLAVQHRSPLIILLMTDGGYGSVRTRALRDGLTQTPLLMSQPSWLAAMEGLGIPGTIVANQAQLETALAGWPGDNGPMYLEIPFDPDAYQAMVEDIR